jgi:hypothetical protein
MPDWPPIQCPWHHPASAWIRTGETEGFCGSCQPLAALYLHRWQELQNEILRLESRLGAMREIALRMELSEKTRLSLIIDEYHKPG